MNAHYVSDKTLFDFQSTTGSAAWQIVNDDVMGGGSTSRFEVTNGVAVFRGEVSLENNGGFASVRSSPARHGLAGCDSFVIRLRGDGRRYKFSPRAPTRVSTARSTNAPFRRRRACGKSTVCHSSISWQRSAAACCPANRRSTRRRSHPWAS
jgi:hypothetical protein